MPWKSSMSQRVPVRHGVMRLVVVGLVLPGVVLVGCSSTAPATGTLSGHLRQVGGPAPGVDQPVPGTVTISGTTTTEVPVGDDGAYRVQLPAGRYTVVGHSPTTGDGATDCPATSDATVTAGTTTTLDAVCALR